MPSKKDIDRTPDPIDRHVGNRVRARRIVLGMSQSELADVVGVSFQQIQKYERGDNRISPSKLWRFGRHMGVPVEWFFMDMPLERGEPAMSDGLPEDRALLELAREWPAFSKEAKALLLKLGRDISRVQRFVEDRQAA